MDIIMIRHGETEDNVERIFSRDDTRLTEKGKGQILNARKLLKDLHYDAVYYSPLARTVESKKLLGLDGIQEDRIRELDFGIFTGKTFNQISDLYPLDAKKWIEDPTGFRVPQGESGKDLYARIEAFLEEIIILDKSALLICHDGVIRNILSWVFDNPQYFFKFKIDNGSINVISINKDFKYIERLNYK